MRNLLDHLRIYFLGYFHSYWIAAQKLYAHLITWKYANNEMLQHIWEDTLISNAIFFYLIQNEALTNNGLIPQLKINVKNLIINNSNQKEKVGISQT